MTSNDGSVERVYQIETDQDLHDLHVDMDEFLLGLLSPRDAPQEVYMKLEVRDD